MTEAHVRWHLYGHNITMLETLIDYLLYMPIRSFIINLRTQKNRLSHQKKSCWTSIQILGKKLAMCQSKTNLHIMLSTSTKKYGRICKMHQKLILLIYMSKWLTAHGRLLPKAIKSLMKTLGKRIVKEMFQIIMLSLTAQICACGWDLLQAQTPSNGAMVPIDIQM